LLLTRNTTWRSSREPKKIASQLTQYQDELEQEASGLQREGESTTAHTVLAMADAIGHLKNAIDSFGVGDPPVNAAIQNVFAPTRALLAEC
jgi:hypothetical protein